MVDDSDSGVRRVSVHVGTVNIDLVLPAEVPVAALLPSILDLVPAEARVRSVDPIAGYQLACFGMAALNPSTTLAQNTIRDGTVLLLTRSPTELPAPCFDDAADAVATILDARASTWTRRTAGIAGAVAAIWLAGLGSALLLRVTLTSNGFSNSGITASVMAVAGGGALMAAVIAHRVFSDEIAGLTLGLLAVLFATVAGYLAVPDRPGAPHVLLAAMGAAVTSVVTSRLTGCRTVAFTTVSCLAIVIAGTALAAAITAAPLHVIGSMSSVAALVLLEVSPRISIGWAGLAPELPKHPPATANSAQEVLRDKAFRADTQLTSLIVAFASTAAIGASCTAISLGGAARPRGVAFAALTGAVLLMRARSHPDLRRTIGLLVTGMVTISMAFALACAASSRHAAWIAAGTGMTAAAAVYSGFVAPRLSLSPVARRSVEHLEFLGLAGTVPLACWICGFYSAARGLHLT